MMQKLLSREAKKGKFYFSFKKTSKIIWNLCLTMYPSDWLKKIRLTKDLDEALKSLFTHTLLQGNSCIQFCRNRLSTILFRCPIFFFNWIFFLACLLAKKPLSSNICIRRQKHMSNRSASSVELSPHVYLPITEVLDRMMEDVKFGFSHDLTVITKIHHLFFLSI